MDIHPVDIVIHILNIIVLFFVLRILLYKPVKKFMQAREDRIKAEKQEIADSRAEIDELKNLAQKTGLGCLIAPNFSTGAVLMMKFAQMASKYFDNAEIIELHHNQKKDAPSGTAVKTALMMAGENTNFTTGNCQEVETIKGARGANSYNNIHIHSVRMPGYIASQEVIFGASGQILTIRHDSMNRECYMDGVLRAVRYVNENHNFVYGLENILD